MLLYLRRRCNEMPSRRAFQTKIKAFREKMSSEPRFAPEQYYNQDIMEQMDVVKRDRSFGKSPY